MDEDATPAASRTIAGARLAIGLLQGIALYLLWRAGDDRVWPATEPALFAPLSMIAFFVPLIAVQGLGSMRPRTLLVWAVAATAALAVLGMHDRFRVWLPDLPEPPRGNGIDERSLPSFGVVFFSAAALFIAHALIAAGDEARKWIARYEIYFDTAWKLGIQLALSLLFVGVFWGVLELGAAPVQADRSGFPGAPHRSRLVCHSGHGAGFCGRGAFDRCAGRPHRRYSWRGAGAVCPGCCR